MDPRPQEDDVRRLERRVVYENAWMSLTEDVVQRRDGSLGTYAVTHSRDFALVIPFDGEHFHLVEQFRYPVGRRLWEFPQGSVAEPADLAPLEVARIELVEEAGLEAAQWHDLGFLHAGYGRSSGGFHVFLALDLTSVPHRREVEEQDMRTGTFTEAGIWSLVDDGLLTDSHSLAALALLDRWRGRRRG
jgi:8-oxo-dGTP pyrophosphatase MutT (NUDIX family)